MRVYQFSLSPDHGLLKVFYPYGCCRFYPTCSEYAHQAIGEHGVVRGGALAVKRLGRCNPWNRGGIDLVPSISKKG
ncbi:membrane protein insertion efficiency factor YidD [bacterium]|nr:MAG: membrane protein insertion efficiency factor YidD [bacterium]